MTSFAFILGVVPLVVADGAGFEMRRALGTAVFSGMLGVTLFGIFLTPVFFLVVDHISHWQCFLRIDCSAEPAGCVMDVLRLGFLRRLLKTLFASAAATSGQSSGVIPVPRLPEDAAASGQK